MQVEYPTEDVFTDINGQELDSKGSRLIKKPHTKLNLTKEHISEYIKCQQDVIYFAENYYYIVDPDKGLSKIELYDFQKIMLHNFNDNRFNILLSARQSGKSTISGLFILWYMIFHNDKVVGILANKEKTAIEIFSKVRTAYEYLPNYLKPGCTDFSKTSLGFDNGSKCIASSTSSTAIRGFTINTLFLDEIAFVPSNIFQEFYNSVYPTISKSKESKIIMVSTANGMNHFYKFWEDAKKGINDFKHFEVRWFDVPGRDEEFKKKTISQIGLFAWMQEFENSFLGSMNTLIQTDSIKELTFMNPIRYMLDNNLKIYEEPEKEKLYIIPVDTSKGVGRDYCVAQVIDVTTYPFKQVAIYRCNTISPMLYIDVVLMMAQMYHNAYLVVENNSEGKEVADGLWYDREYINMYNEEMGKNKDVGFRTTKRTKSISLTTCKNLVETKKLIINDLDTIDEISTFILHSNNVYGAEKDKHDDTVTALLNFCYFLRTEEFKSLYKAHDLKKELYSEQLEKLEDEFKLPIFRTTDGGETVESSETKNKKDIPKTLLKIMKEEKIMIMKK